MMVQEGGQVTKPITIIVEIDLITIIIHYTACPPFTFKNTLSNADMCQPCPLFSNTTENDTAVTECPCDPGYYRAENEAALPSTSE